MAENERLPTNTEDPKDNSSTDEKKYDEKDTNKDGKVSKKEQADWDRKNMTRDRLEADLMQSEFAWAWKLISSDDELNELWNKAINKGWTTDRFTAALMGTDFYQENDGFKRTNATQKSVDPATWQTRLEGAKAQIRDDLAEMGIDVTQVPEGRWEKMAERYLNLGFDTNAAGRAAAYQDWLSTRMSNFMDKDFDLAGAAASNRDSLTAYLIQNGFDPSLDRWTEWVEDRVKGIASGDMQMSDAQSAIRQQAATKYRGFSDRILAGETVQDVASGYLELMADTFEIDPNSIQLKDPYIQQALMGDAETGTPMGLWDFQKQLRQDERWQYTKQANNQASGLARSVLEMFGFVG